MAAAWRAAIELADQARSRRESVMQQANTNIVIRNPFGTMDVPEPGDAEVMHYAITATLAGDATDGNAAHWTIRSRNHRPARRHLGEPLERRRRSDHRRRYAGDMEAGPRGGPRHRRTDLSAVRLGRRPTARTDRCRARERQWPDREIHQPDQSRDHAAMDRAAWSIPRGSTDAFRTGGWISGGERNESA